MLREEPRSSRVADFEFQLWECWESDDGVPGTSAKSRALEFEVPVLEDDLWIQVAVSNVCRGLVKKTLELKCASTLLCGLQDGCGSTQKSEKRLRNDLLITRCSDSEN